MEKQENKYVKRTQKDYSMSFKMSVVREYEESKDQELLELREKVKVLERKNARLEKELEEKDIKAGFFDLMIDIAEEEYGVQIRKDTAGPFLPRDNELPPQVPQAQEPHCRHGGDKARAGLCL